MQDGRIFGRSQTPPPPHACCRRRRRPRMSAHLNASCGLRAWQPLSPASLYPVQVLLAGIRLRRVFMLIVGGLICLRITLRWALSWWQPHIKISIYSLAGAASPQTNYSFEPPSNHYQLPELQRIFIPNARCQQMCDW
jgi:hypothetical protein